jgi:hypothetical protein
VGWNSETMKKIHLEKLTVVQLVNKFSVSHKFRYRVYTRQSLTLS